MTEMTTADRERIDAAATEEYERRLKAAIDAALDAVIDDSLDVDDRDVPTIVRVAFEEAGIMLMIRRAATARFEEAFQAEARSRTSSRTHHTEENP